MRSKAIAKLGLRLRRRRRDQPLDRLHELLRIRQARPDRDLPAYDDTIQAECGLPAVQEQLTGEANYVGTIMADKVAGLTALYATMMALFHRERTGEGQRPSTAVSPRLIRCVITNAGGMFAASRDVRERTVRVEVHAHGLRGVLGIDGELPIVGHERVEVPEVVGNVVVADRGIGPEHVVRFHHAAELGNVVLDDERPDQRFEQRDIVRLVALDQPEVEERHVTAAAGRGSCPGAGRR